MVPDQLWRSDGTTAGTWKIRDFPAGEPGQLVVSDLTVLAGALYFVADDGSHGRELWRSDGTATGTTLVKDAVPGEAGAQSASLFVFGDRLLYAITATDPSPTVELWASNGTEAGTVRLHTFDGALSAPLSWFVRAGDLAFFAATDGAHGRELWRTDGTAAGTVIVADLAPGPSPASSSPMLVGEVDGHLLFLNLNEPYGLWRSDGTETGTTPVRGDLLGVWLEGRECAAAGGKLVFPALDLTHGTELWASDGTTAGTVLVRDIAPGVVNGSPRSSVPLELLAVGGRVFFSADDSVAGRELWVSDGTDAGTSRIRDIRSGGKSSYPTALVANGGLLYFNAYDGSDRELWVSDGTEPGTREAVNLAGDAGSSSFGEAAGVGTLLYLTGYTASGQQLWTSDGGGIEIIPVATAGLAGLTRVGTRVYFMGFNSYDAVSELWTSNGTVAGTHTVPAAPPAAFSGQQPRVFAAAGLRLYYRTDEGPFSGLAMLDTATGAQANVPLPADTGYVGNMAAVAGRLYFADLNPGAVWITDGTQAGPVRLTAGDVDCFQENGNLRALGNALLFSRTECEHGNELWRSDGTAAGTGLVADICPGACSSIVATQGGNSDQGDLVVADSALFFVADDGVHGRELWRSDGTAAGTVLVADLAPGAAGATVMLLGAVGDLALFAFDDGAHGVEPWVSDGTASGTRLLADLNPGPRGSWPGDALAAGDAIYFAASDDPHGRELWRTDGTAAGTVLLGDVSPGPSSSSPILVAVTDDLVYFHADDGVHGTELWAVPYNAVHELKRRVARGDGR